jgi:hypothetical protein
MLLEELVLVLSLCLFSTGQPCAPQGLITSTSPSSGLPLLCLLPATGHLCWGKRIAIRLDLNHSLVKCQLTHFTSLSLYFLFCKMGKMLTAEVSFIGWNGNIKFLSRSGQ